MFCAKCCLYNETVPNYGCNFNLTLCFSYISGYLTRSAIILKSNAFKHTFNLVMFYDFQNFFQGKVVVKIL